MSTGTRDFNMVTGIVIKAEPVGEYDRRVVLLTKERGKITAFAKYARKPGNKLMAPTNPFSFGQFKVYSGRNAYSLAEADISNYFEPLRQDFEAAYYGMYFLEICDYYGRENSDDTAMLKLLYQALRALTNMQLPNILVRSIFECKVIMVNGEYQDLVCAEGLSDTVKYTLEYIWNTPVEKIFSFTLAEPYLRELRIYCRKLCKETMDRDFKSIQILENIV